MARQASEVGKPLAPRRYYLKSGAARGGYRSAGAQRAAGRPGKLTAEYNFQHADDAGRRLMPLQFLHPEDGHVADENGLVDLNSRCGTTVRMLLKGVRLIWSCDMPVINTMIETRALRIAPGYENERYKYALVDPAWTRRDVFAAWFDAEFEPGTFEASDEYKRMRTACRIPGEEMPGDRQLNAAFEIQRQTGHYGRVSLLAHMPMPRSVAPLVHDAMNVRIKRLRTERAALSDDEALSHEELKMLVSALHDLRESHFAPKVGNMYREPSERSRKMLWSLDRYRAVGSIFAYAILGTTRRDETIQGYIFQLKRFENLARELIPTIDIRDPWQVGRALNYVAFSHRLDGRISKWARYNLCQVVRIILLKTNRFCLSTLSNAALRSEAPAVHPQDARFRQRLQSRYGKLRPAMRAKRKKRSDEIARHYERVIDGAAFRARQIANDGQAGRGAIDYLLKPINGGKAFRQFEVDDDELDANGLPTSRKLTKTWRCWRTEAAWDSMLRPGASVRENGGSVHYRRQDVEKHSKPPVQFIFELVDVQCESGGDPILPWYIDMGDSLVLVSPGHMTLDQRLSRHDCCRRLKLPDYAGSPTTLLNFERDRSTLARLGMALEKPRRFFPLEEYDHAMMLAAHALDTVVQTWCRPHEVLQQTAYQQDWERAEDDRNDLDPAEDRGFYAIRKVSIDDPATVKPTYIECSDSLYVSAMRIVALMKRRWFPSGVIPTTRPGVAEWKLEPQPWIFSASDGALRQTQVTYFLRLLLAGIADATLHDFRHAGSHRANKTGVILTLIKAGLGQRCERLARYYSRLCLEDRRERRTENANLRRAEAADMRARALALEKEAV